MKCDMKCQNDEPTTSSLSNEIVLSDNSREVVLRLFLDGGGESLELVESHWVMNAFFEQVEFWLTDTEETVHLEETFSRIIERVEADWFEGQTIAEKDYEIRPRSMKERTIYDLLL